MISKEFSALNLINLALISYNFLRLNLLIDSAKDSIEISSTSMGGENCSKISLEILQKHQKK